MKIVRMHHNTTQEAIQKLEGALTRLITSLGDSVSQLEHSWQQGHASFSFVANGFNVKGTLIVDESNVVLDLNLPFPTRIFEGSIRPSIELELDRILNGEIA